MDINSITLSGKLNMPFQSYEEKGLGVFTIHNNSLSDNRTINVKIFVFDNKLITFCKNYLVYANKNKRLAISGVFNIEFETAYSDIEFQATANNIILIDYFKSSKEINENKIEFD